MRVVKIACVICGLLASLGVSANHILGGNITYTCTGVDQYLFTLTIYKDCFGATTAPTIENVFFIPDAACPAIAFSAPFDLVSVSEISDLCPSELVNSSCLGGFNPGAEAVVYQQTITLDPGCIWEVSYGSGDWNYFANVDNSLLPTAYLSTEVNTNFGCNNSVSITSAPIPYYCTGDVVSHFLTFDNPDGYTLNVSLAAPEIANEIPVPFEVGSTDTEPIPGLVFDPVTYEITFTAPVTFGNYIVAFEIEMLDAAGNVVGVFHESMAFTIRLCDDLPTYFETPPLSDIHDDVTEISTTELEACVGDSICFSIDAVNDNPFRSVTISSANLATEFVTVTTTSTPGNPGTMDVCIVPSITETGVHLIDFNAVDDACVNPDTDDVQIEITVLPSLTMNLMDSVLCFGENIVLQATGDTNYTWNVLSGTSVPAISGTTGTQDIVPDNNMQIEVIANNAPLTCNWRDTLNLQVSLYDLGGVVVDESCVQDDGSVTLTVLGGVGPYSYTWDVDPANTDNVTGLSGGSDVNVTVTDTGFPGVCTHSETFTIGTPPPPTASIGGDQTICAGEDVDIPVTLTGTGPFAVTINGTVYPGLENGDLVTFTPAVNTVYTLTLAQDANMPPCDYLTPSSVSVTVRDVPTGVLSGPAAVCIGGDADITFTATPAGATLATTSATTELNGTLTDGAITNFTPAGPATTYSITEVAYTDAPTCPNTTVTSVTVDVDPLPTGVLSFAGASTICAGDAAILHFELTGTGPWTVAYTAGGVAQTDVTTAFNGYDLILAPTPGVTTEYCITQITDTGTGCISTTPSCATLTVNPLPTGSVAAMGPWCDGDNVDLTLTLTGTGPYTINMSQPSGAAVTLANPYNTGDVVSIADAETGDYCLTSVTDANMCVATGLPNCVTVTADPNPTVDITGLTTVCIGDDFVYTFSTLTGTAPFDVSWSMLALDDDAVLDSGTSLGIDNGDSFTVAPTEPAYLVIDAISDATAGACASGEQAGIFSLATLTYTEVSISEDIVICAGEAVPVTVTFTNPTGPVLWVDLGFEIVEIPIGDLDASNQFTFNSAYDSSVAGSGTIDIAGYIDDSNFCDAIGDGSMGVEVVAIPTGTLSANSSICPGTNTNLTLDLPATGGPYDATITNDAGDPDISFTGVTGAQVVNVAPAATTVYTLSFVGETGSTALCSSDPASAVTVTVTTLPALAGPEEVLCANTGDSFQVTFEIVGGDPATYNVTDTYGAGGSISAGPPYIYTSNSIPDNTAVTFTLDDGAGCAPVDVVVDAYDCPILTFSGTLDGTAITACEDGTFCVIHNADEVMDADDVLSFAILDGCDFSTSLILNITTSDCWDLTTLAFPPFAYDTQYYVVALAGNDIGTGVVDLGDPNLNVSDCVPVYFASTPEATLSGGSTICAGAANEVTIDVVGAGPFNVTYTAPNGITELIEIDAADFPMDVTAELEGDYTVTVVSTLGCVGVAGSTTTVAYFPAITAALSTGGAICDGDDYNLTIDLTTDGAWDLNLGYDDGSGVVPVDVDGVAASPYIWVVDQEGTYSIESVTDGNGCTTNFDLSEEVVVNGLPTAAWAETAINFCAGGSGDIEIDLTGLANYTINYSLDLFPQPDWLATSDVFSAPGVSTAGTYTLTGVTDGNGCFAALAADLVLTEVALPLADAGADQSACSDIEVLLGTPAVGGNTYDWTVDVGDVAAHLNNTVAAEPTASIENLDSPTVYDYVFTLTVTEPIVGCSSTDDVLVSIDPVPAANAGADVDLCYGEVAILDGGGDGTCAWTDNGAFDSAAELVLCAATTTALTASTTFDLTVESAAGCTNTDQVTVSIPDAFTWSADFDAVVCFGTCTAAITITPEGSWGGYSIGGDLAGLALVDQCAGIYNFTITDAQLCTVDGSVEVLEQAAYYIDDVIIDQPNCFGDTDGEVEVLAAGVVEYDVDGTTSITSSFDDLAAGDYYINVTDLNGCQADTTVTLLENSPAIGIVTNFDETVVCVDTPLEFEAIADGGSGLFTYNWYQDTPPPGLIYAAGSPLILTLEEELLLYVVAYDDNGCPSDTLAMEANFSTPVNVTATPTVDQTICIGECVDVSSITSGGTGPITVTWVELGIFDDDEIGNNVSYQVCPEETLSYAVFADDGCAPVASDTVLVNVNPAPVVEMDFAGGDGCFPVTITLYNLTLNDTTTCAWSFGDGNTLAICDSVDYTYWEPGTYTPSLSLTSNQGCTASDSSLVPITVYGYPEADFYWDPNPVTTLENEVILVNTSTDAVSYIWEVSTIGQFTTEDVPLSLPSVDYGFFEACLLATNSFNCTDTICYSLVMESELLIYVPNAFTPDNDGINDVLIPSVAGIVPSTYVFRVLDRWGHVVYETNELGEGWDGSFKGGDYYVQEDVFIWQIEGQDIRSADVVTKVGHITIVR